MNVGSILNNDSPPSDNESNRVASGKEKSQQQEQKEQKEQKDHQQDHQQDQHPQQQQLQDHQLQDHQDHQLKQPQPATPSTASNLTSSLPPINTSAIAVHSNSDHSPMTSISPNTAAAPPHTFPPHPSASSTSSQASSFSHDQPSLDQQRPNLPTSQRHSINNLLNDNQTVNDNQKADAGATTSPTSQPAAQLPPPPPAKQPSRNSIADITNDKDVDIDTGKETSLNASRQSSLGNIQHPHQHEQQPKSEGQPKPEPSSHRSSSLVAPEEINRLEQIKATTSPSPSSPSRKNNNKSKGKRKPRRYERPPIWAQEWNPASAGGNGINHHDANGSASNGGSETTGEPTETSHLTDKAVFARNTTESVDLECSITNTIPAPSVVRTIAEWIYANFVEIPLANRKYVELELKFGTIMDKSAGRRLDINVSTECIYNNPSAIHFDSGVHEVGWNDIKSFLDELEKQYQDEMKKQNSTAHQKPKRKFSTLDTDITDEFYQITQRGETPKSIRISKDNTLDPPRHMAIHKQRLSDLYIHNPSSMYDLRLSLSFEQPVPEQTIEPIQKNNRPNLTRIKKRSSWSHRPTVTKFDLTRVLTPREIKTKSGRTQVEHDQSFEAELEIDTLELFAGFDKFKEGADNIRFEELVEIFMNNARCLNNRVTRLASGR